MEVIKEVPREEDGWYYPTGDDWWRKISSSFRRYSGCGFVTPNKFLCIKVNKNNTAPAEVCDFIHQAIEELVSKYNIIMLENYGYVIRDEDKDNRIIVLKLFIKK